MRIFFWALGETSFFCELTSRVLGLWVLLWTRRGLVIKKVENQYFIYSNNAYVLFYFGDICFFFSFTILHSFFPFLVFKLGWLSFFFLWMELKVTPVDLSWAYIITLGDCSPPKAFRGIQVSELKWWHNAFLSRPLLRVYWLMVDVQMN